MASADPRAELECPICLHICEDPVTLKCGHNLCKDCIIDELYTQEDSGDFSCPECNQTFQEQPEMERNVKPGTVMETFLSAQPVQEESGVFCTYCVDSPVPAVRSCLLCEVSLCDKHLEDHTKSPEHVLTDPTLSMESRKCSVHKKILEYYCTEDNTCICVCCSIAEEHRGHQVEKLDEASEKKKDKLRNVRQKIITKREETEERVQSLEERRSKVLNKAVDDTDTVNALFGDLKRRLENLQGEVLREISKPHYWGLMTMLELIRQLDINEKLSRKIRHIEKVCKMTDPLTVLQGSDTGDLCDTEDGDGEESDTGDLNDTEDGDDEDRKRHDQFLNEGGNVEMSEIAHSLHKGLSAIISDVNVYFYTQEAADISLDATTASNKLQISDDGKSASWSDIKQNNPETPERFHGYPQVLSSQSFSSGHHYWEVDVRGSISWIVGVCYPSIDRGGVQSEIGDNNKSWGLVRNGKQYWVIHDSNNIPIPDKIPSKRVRIYLDYEAGRISFYAMCGLVRHLHTFTTTFTEPLHAVLYIWRGCIRICGRN